MNRYPDEYLDHWADRYIEENIARYGITLETYLAHHTNIDRLLTGDVGMLPLLRVQKVIAGEILEQDLQENPLLDPRTQREIDNLPQRNGAPFEPLHHHAHPGNHQSDFNVKRRIKHGTA